MPDDSQAVRGGDVNDNRSLALVGSEDRAAVLVDALKTTPSKASRRKLARKWFNSCDAIGPYRHALREQFEGIGFFTDAAKADVPEFPVTVYRGAWSDDDVAWALSWTTDREKAEWFARYLTSPRAWFLGIKRDEDGVLPTVFQGTCIEAFGYLTDRDEHEVIAKTVVDIRPIAELVKVAS